MDVKKILNATKNTLSKAGTAVLQQVEEQKKWETISIGNLSINETDKLIKLNHKIYSFSDIIDCEIIEDGSSVIKSSLIGTAAKGLTFGLAGYLTSSKKEKKFCNKLEVKITINDFKNPYVCFKYITKKTKKDSKDYEHAFNEAQKCLSTIKIVIENK